MKIKSILEIKHHPWTDNRATGPPIIDGPRICGPFPARVKGQDATGRRFKTDSELENLSAHDCLLILAARVEVGRRLCIAARVGKALVALCGEVTDASLRADGRWKTVVRFTRYRFVHQRKH